MWTAPQKRILAVSDISCIGKCSLTVALPVLSACGHECAVLPTAILSTHTADRFGHYVCRDLSDDLLPIVRHWNALELPFDAIYVGYLTSAAQARLVGGLIDTLRGPDTLLLVDPILGDNGALYRGLSDENIDAIRLLCAGADLITPNLTEAALLLGEPWDTPPEVLSDRLRAVGAKRAVLTGVPFGGDRIGTLSRDYTSGTASSHQAPRAEGMLHGTGDVFASALIGLLLGGMPFHPAAAEATDFTTACIRRTLTAPDRRWYGIRFEPELPELSKRLKAADRSPMA